MQMRFLAAPMALIAAGVCCPIANAQSPLPLKYAGKPTQPAITAADAMTRLYIFADDSMMGRAAGTEGGLRGTAYIEREVRRLGLVPAGDNGTFFQAVPLYNKSFDETSQLTAGDTPVVGGRDYFPLSPGGRAKSVNGAQVIYAGDTRDATTLIPASETVGRAVLVAGPSAGMARRYPQAAAFIIVPPESALPQLREIVSHVFTQMKEPDDSIIRPLTLAVPVGSVSKFLGVPVANAHPGTIGKTLSGEVRYRIIDAPARNVVAIIPGSDPVLRKEYVALGAHNDHLGLRDEGPLDTDSLRAFNEIAERLYIARTHQLPGFPGSGLTATERASIKVNLDSLHRIRPARMDSIYNGADDDGSGSIGLLEIAEKFATDKSKPKRSLLFVWHTGEELGLFGSEFFTDHPAVPRDSIVGQLNIDMIGRGDSADLPGGGPAFLQMIGSHRLSTELGDFLDKLGAKHGFKFDYSFDAPGHPEQYYCRSDHYEYARYGIPIAFMSTGGHVDYHQVTDEPQYIDYTHLARVADFVADAAQGIANMDHRLVVDHPKPDPRAECVQ